MRNAALLLVLLPLGGCLSDSDTANNRSVLPPTVKAGTPTPAVERDEPRQLCESTLVGSTPKTVCY